MLLPFLLSSFPLFFPLLSASCKLSFLLFCHLQLLQGWLAFWSGSSSRQLPDSFSILGHLSRCFPSQSLWNIWDWDCPIRQQMEGREYQTCYHRCAFYDKIEVLEEVFLFPDYEVLTFWLPCTFYKEYHLLLTLTWVPLFCLLIWTDGSPEGCSWKLSKYLYQINLPLLYGLWTFCLSYF